MISGKVKGGSVIAATLLSALVLGLFAPLRNYGPQSVVRSFHQAIASRDINGIARYTIEDPSDPNFQRLVQFVSASRLYGQPRLVAVQPENDRAKVLIVFQTQFGTSQPVVFFVDRDAKSQRWRVNCTATIIALTDFPRSSRGF